MELKSIYFKSSDEKYSIELLVHMRRRTKPDAVAHLRTNLRIPTNYLYGSPF